MRAIGPPRAAGVPWLMKASVQLNQVCQTTTSCWMLQDSGVTPLTPGCRFIQPLQQGLEDTMQWGHTQSPGSSLLTDTGVRPAHKVHLPQAQVLLGCQL